MNFLADEDVESAIVKFLRSEGFDVRYIIEEGRRSKDEEILKLANQEKRILITGDKDFGEIIFFRKSASFGVVLLRFSTDDAKEKVSLLSRITDRLRSGLEKKFVVITDNTIRIRDIQS